MPGVADVRVPRVLSVRLRVLARGPRQARETVAGARLWGPTHRGRGVRHALYSCIDTSS